jgi:hypothetical protein
VASAADLAERGRPSPHQLAHLTHERGVLGEELVNIRAVASCCCCVERSMHVVYGALQSPRLADPAPGGGVLQR